MDTSHTSVYGDKRRKQYIDANYQTTPSSTAHTFRDKKNYQQQT